MARGFYPAGGGAAATVVGLSAASFTRSDADIAARAEAHHRGFAGGGLLHVSEREVATLEAHFPQARERKTSLRWKACGPGNARSR